MAWGKFSGQYVVIETTHGFHSVVRTWLRLRCFHKARDWDGLPPGPLVNGHFANWSSVQCTFSSPQALGWILRGKVGLPTNFFSYTSWHRSKLTGFILSYFLKLVHKNFPFFKTDGFPKHYITLLSQNCQSVFFLATLGGTGLGCGQKDPAGGLVHNWWGSRWGFGGRCEQESSMTGGTD